MTKPSLLEICMFSLVFLFLFCDRRMDVFAEAADMHGHGKTYEHSMHDHSIKSPEVVVDLETRPAELIAGSPGNILFTIKDFDGNPMQDLTITHEKLMHVIIIGADFSVFAHIHPDDSSPFTPEMMKTAQFTVRYDFPKAGKYLIALDSAVKDVPFSEQFELDVSGAPEMGPIKKDFSAEKKFGDYRATLSLSDNRIVHGKKTALTYSIYKGKEPVKDLEPYLAAPMHLAIISADLAQFMHAHGEVSATKPGGHHDHTHMSVPDRFGPDITAYIVFPSKGIYQIFSEVKHQGKVIPLSFMVEVE